MYERLIQSFPEILFESCASGGGRFDPEKCYRVNKEGIYTGSELMNIGLITSDSSCGECTAEDIPSCDFDSKIYVLEQM